MVRGRRARVHDAAPSVVARAMASSHIVVDDQFCASPKRKDCKIEEVTKTMKAIRTYGPASAKQQLSSVGKMSFDVLGGTKTRSKTIKNYFKTDQQQHQQQIKQQHEHEQQNDFKTNYIDHTIMNGDCITSSSSSSTSTIELTEDTCDQIFVKYTTTSPVYNNGIDKNHAIKFEDDMTSNTTGNIFLQEPVLSLNVDKSPNQPSSIKINKTLEVVPIFSPNNNYHHNLNGQFKEIVTLSNNKIMSPSSPRRDTLLPAGGESNFSILLNNHDSNSCDSGVVIDNKLELSPSRRRKPTTPHRILCPSPVKHPSIDKSPSSVSLATNYTLMDGTTSSAYFNGLQKKNPKSRRRLNATQSENNSSMKAPQLIGGVILTNETLMKINNTPTNNNISQKSVLNSAINPTAEQNTNNNYKKRTNGHHQHRERQHKNHNVPNNNNNTNKELTDFFPVRRSVRKTKRAVQEEMMRSIEKAIIEGRDDGLKIEHFEGKGRGVVADRGFKRGEFVVEYIGDLITIAEANQREKKYSLDENAGCYMYYFKHRNQQYCIDATAESGKLGRLVNHSRNGNLITKVVVVKNHPHLVLIAKDDIQPGEELTYDYGDRSKEALLHHPWLAL